MPIVPPALIAKLDPLIRRMASTHEALAATRALQRRLRAEKYDLNDLAETLAPTLLGIVRPRDSRHAMVGTCLAHKERLSLREQDFVDNIQHWHGELNPKQNDWLLAIYERLQREGAV